MMCLSCNLTLHEPFIRCAECDPVVDFCLQCFAKGREFLSHANYHNYEIKTVSFPLFESMWSAREEVMLLDATEEFGFGNWNQIAQKVQTKTMEECENHYLHYYVEKSIPTLPQFTVSREMCLRRPMRYCASEKPPRPDGSNADDALFVAGYMPARADFIVEHDNFAESDVKDIRMDEDTDDDLITELKVAAADIYLTRLHERNKRKQIIEKYGLLDLPFINSECVSLRYGRVERELRDNFRQFAQIMEPADHEKLIQSLLYQRFLERRITQLQEYRKSGLRYFRDALHYERLKKKRKSYKPKFKLDEALLHIENPVACHVWLQRQFSGPKKKCAVMPNLPMLQRKQATPLDLDGVPGVEKLNEDEKQLCSALRFLPETYLLYRTMLQKESYEHNGIRLRTARILLKIDVNKTRRLFQFLAGKGLIKDLPSS